MAMMAKGADAGWRKRNAAFIRFNFSRDADNHPRNFSFQAKSDLLT
jgi:hypothetical protein